jgi:hypothetical protein
MPKPASKPPKPAAELFVYVRRVLRWLEDIGLKDRADQLRARYAVATKQTHRRQVLHLALVAAREAPCTCRQLPHTGDCVIMQRLAAELWAEHWQVRKSYHQRSPHYQGEQAEEAERARQQIQQRSKR